MGWKTLLTRPAPLSSLCWVGVSPVRVQERLRGRAVVPVSLPGEGWRYRCHEGRSLGPAV